MVSLNDIHPMTDFNRNTKRYIRRLKKTGNPEVLTVNGEAQLVVQSAQSYQKLLEAAGQSDAVAGIRRGLAQAKRGKGKPMRKFLVQLAAKNGFQIK